MKLKDYHAWPPGGWQYFEPRTNWRAPAPASTSFNETARLMLDMRQNNKRVFPESERTIESCRQAMSDYTVARVAKLGAWHFLSFEDGEQPPSTNIQNKPGVRSKRGGCATCGKK